MLLTNARAHYGRTRCVWSTGKSSLLTYLLKCPFCDAWKRVLWLLVLAWLFWLKCVRVKSALYSVVVVKTGDQTKCTAHTQPIDARVTEIYRPHIRQEYPLNLSILLSGGKESKSDFPSNGEWTGISLALRLNRMLGGNIRRHFVKAIERCSVTNHDV